MTFKDHFSGHAADYAVFRPRYPRPFFPALVAHAAARDLGWDVATGSGQCAVGLAAEVDRVVATDASADQVLHAERHPRVEYRVEPAERSTLRDRSVDVVTIAQALHWLDLDAFWPEVRRVARPGAVVAAMTYGIMRVSPEIDRELDRLYHDVVGAHWPPERRHVENGYRELTFPFEPIEPPAFVMEADWSLDALVGYLGTWSAVTRYRKAVGVDPLVEARARVSAVWGEPSESRRIEWPLALRWGRVP